MPQIKTLSLTKILLATISLIFVVFSVLLPLSTKATEFTSTNFKVLDPVIQPGGYSTSSSYRLNGVFAQIAIGTSTASSFTLNSGFLFFPFVSSTTVFSHAGNGSIGLGWTRPSGFLGWNPSSYSVGQATTAGGPYTYTSVGDVFFSERIELTNSTTYYFIIRVEDAFGNSIATTTEIFNTPSANILAMRTIEFSTASASSTLFVNSNGTKLNLDFPANFLSSCGNVNRTILSQQESVVIIDKPLLSGKLAADTFYDVSFKCSDTGNAVTSLDSAVTFTFTYTDSDISGINESTMAAYRWTGSAWEALSGATIDTAANTVTVTSQNLSTFGLFGSAPSASPSPSPSSSQDNQAAGSVTFLPPIPKPIFPLLTPPSEIKRCGDADFLCDKVTDITDFSSFLYLSGFSPINNPADINRDGAIDIADASIMFYHWSEPGIAATLLSGNQVAKTVFPKSSLEAAVLFVNPPKAPSLKTKGIQAESLVILPAEPADSPPSLFKNLINAALNSLLKFLGIFRL